MGKEVRKRREDAGGGLERVPKGAAVNVKEGVGGVEGGSGGEVDGQGVEGG